MRGHGVGARVGRGVITHIIEGNMNAHFSPTGTIYYAMLFTFYPFTNDPTDGYPSVPASVSVAPTLTLTCMSSCTV